MINIKENEKLSIMNHSCAHLLAQAVKHLYPNAKFWVGPVVEEGFYYDIDLGEDVIKEDDLARIEKEMKKCSKDAKHIIRKELTKDEALNLFKEDSYKIDLIERMDEENVISCYTQGDFTDLCRGPHMSNTKEIKYFKLIKFSGAYFKGDSSNKMLQRIYGVCFPTQEELDNHLKELEEMKMRDHRKIGKDLEIFMISDLVGKGLPLWLPKGSELRRRLERYITDKEISSGYQHVTTPSLGSVNLYKTSGHWDHYKENMFPKMKIDEEEFVLRPMNCPHHMLIFANGIHSYKELPIRYAEIANDFRYEESGAVCGLERVRCMTQNDSHIFCRPDQIKEEFAGVVKLILAVYQDMGITDYTCRLSLRDPLDKEKYYDDDEMWIKAENELREVLNGLHITYFEATGEAAFYGPKLDVEIKTAIGHELTLSTIQLDFLLPQKFELSYVDENGEKVRPVVIHRAILGTLDRFVAFYLEETKGYLPLWLAPIQVQIIPVHKEYHGIYAEEVYKRLKEKGFRVELDNRNEKLGYKLRESVIKKIPYMLILGQNEVDNHSVSYRRAGSEETITVSLEEFIELLNQDVQNKVRYDK